jgi:hypothetical protein
VTSYADGDDGWFQAGNPRKTRFVDNGNGTISDRATGLTWVKEPGDCGGAFGSAGSPSPMTFPNACAQCLALAYGGFSDWRLPNAYELASLYDATRFGPRIDPIFTNTQNDFYWTSTTDAAFDPAYALVCFFQYPGGSQHDRKTAAHFVRPVRGGRINANW